MAGRRKEFTQRPGHHDSGYITFTQQQLKYKKKFFHVLNLLDRFGRLDWNDALENDQWIYFRWSYPGQEYVTTSSYRLNRIPNNELVRYILVYFEDESDAKDINDHLFCSTDMNEMITLPPQRGPLLPGSNDGEGDRQQIRNAMHNSVEVLPYLEIANDIDELSAAQNRDEEFKNAMTTFQAKMDDPLNQGPMAAGDWRLGIRFEPPLPVAHPMPAPDGAGTSTAPSVPVRAPAATVSVPPIDIPDYDVGPGPDPTGSSTGGPTATVSVPPPDVAAPEDLLSQALEMSELDYDVGADAGAVAGEDDGDMGTAPGLGSARMPSPRRSPARSPIPSPLPSLILSPLRMPGPRLATRPAIQRLDVDSTEATVATLPDMGAASGLGSVSFPPHGVLYDPGESSSGPGVPHRSPTPPVSVPVHDVAHIPHLDYDVLPVDPFNEGAFANPEQDDDANEEWLKDNWVQEFEAQAAQHGYGVPPADHLNDAGADAGAVAGAVAGEDYGDMGTASGLGSARIPSPLPSPILIPPLVGVAPAPSPAASPGDNVDQRKKAPKSMPRKKFTHRPNEYGSDFNVFIRHQLSYKKKFFHILNQLDRDGRLDWNDALANDRWIYFRWTHPGIRSELFSNSYRLNRIPNNELVRYILVMFEDEAGQKDFNDQLFCSTVFNEMLTLRPQRGPLIPGSNDGEGDRQQIRNAMYNSVEFLPYLRIANEIDYLSKAQNRDEEFKNALTTFQAKMDDPLNQGPNAAGNWPPPPAPNIEPSLPVAHPMPAPDGAGTSTAPSVPVRAPTATVSVPPHDIDDFDVGVDAGVVAGEDYGDDVPEPPPKKKRRVKGPKKATVESLPDMGTTSGLVSARMPGPRLTTRPAVQWIEVDTTEATVAPLSDMGMASGLGFSSFPPHDVIPDTGGPSTGHAVPYRSPTATVSVPPPDVAAPQDLLSQALAMSELDYDAGADAGAVAGEDYGDMGTTSGLGFSSFPPHDVIPDTGGPSTRRAVPYRSPTATVSVPPLDVTAPHDLLSQALAMSELDYDAGADAGAVAGEDYGDMGMASGLGSERMPGPRRSPARSSHPSPQASRAPVDPPDVAARGHSPRLLHNIPSEALADLGEIDILDAQPTPSAAGSFRQVRFSPPPIQSPPLVGEAPAPSPAASPGHDLPPPSPLIFGDDEDQLLDQVLAEIRAYPAHPEDILGDILNEEDDQQ